MKQLFQKKYMPGFLICLFVVMAVPHVTHADFFDLTKKTIDALLVTPALLVLKISSWLTIMAGVLLNTVLRYTVVDMSAHYNDLPAINSAWSTVRDLANMFFIFILLYAAIKSIIGQGGDVKKLIVDMVIAAVLINFSLFGTKVLIDTSNLMTLTIYNAVAPAAGTSSWNDPAARGLSNSLMQPFSVQSIWSINGESFGNISLTAILGSAVTLIVCFIFLSISAMFIVRYITLILVLILSPVALVSHILPGLKGISKQWSDALSSQLTFAPVFMLMTWITLKVSADILPTAKTWSEAFAGSYAQNGTGATATAKAALTPGMFDIVLRFGLVTALLIASLTIAKSASGKAGGYVNKLSGFVSGTLGGATVGVAGRFGRGTLGRAGQAIADNERLKDLAPNSRMARLALLAGNKTASASFDGRAMPGVGKQLGLGDARKGGFAKDLKDKTEAEKKYADSAFKTSDLVQYKAEQDFENIKAGRATPQTLARLDKERQKEQEQLLVEKEKYDDQRVTLAARGASADELKEIDAHINRIEKDIDGTANISQYARSKVDKIKGVDESAAKKRAAADLNLTEPQLAELLRNNDATAKAAVAGHQRDKAVNVRKTQYARGLEEQRTFGRKADTTGRHLIFGKVKRENIAAATAIRGSIKEKSIKDKLADAITALTQENAPAAPPPTPPPGPTTT